MTAFDMVAMEAHQMKEDDAKKAKKAKSGSGIGGIVLLLALFLGAGAAMPLLWGGTVAAVLIGFTAMQLDKVVDKFRADKEKRYVKQNWQKIEVNPRINRCNSIYWSSAVPIEKKDDVIKICRSPMIQNAMKANTKAFCKEAVACFGKDVKIDVKCPGISSIEISRASNYNATNGHTFIEIEYGNFSLPEAAGKLFIRYDMDTGKIDKQGWNDLA